MRKLIILTAVAIALTGCGVKNDLIKPNGQTTSRDEQNPSKPPYPLGR
jgi:predicted small lipoprotein YifL